jgi:hypothetical protein
MPYSQHPKSGEKGNHEATIGPKIEFNPQVNAAGSTELRFKLTAAAQTARLDVGVGFELLRSAILNSSFFLLHSLRGGFGWLRLRILALRPAT